MRKVLVSIIAIAAVVIVVGCGSAAETSSTGASERPDAVATAATDTSPSPVSDASSRDASVVVNGSGFSHGKYNEVGYGLVLKNTSTSMDATDVQVTINLLSKSGGVLKTEDTTLNLIPAGETFYFGGSTYVSKGDRPRKMETFVDVGSSVDAQYTLPHVLNVRVVMDPYAGVTVKGQVKNDLGATLSSFALIGCVLFDANDKVVGGGFSFLTANLPSGRTAGFEVGNGPGATPSSKVKRAEVSMDNACE